MDDKVIIRRAKLVEHMHAIVCDLNNEGGYYTWIETVPDEPTEDDFLEIAGNDELYAEVCRLFRNVLKCYGLSGFIVNGDNKAY